VAGRVNGLGEWLGERNIEWMSERAI